MPSTRFRPLRPIVLAIIVALAGTGWWYWGSQPAAPRQLQQAQAAFREGRFSEAEQLAKQALSDRQLRNEALLLAGKAAIQQLQAAEAVGYFDQIPDEDTAVAVEARWLAGDVLLNGLCRLTDAERQLRKALAHNPHHAPANALLAYLLGVCGRSWEAAPHRLELIRQDAFSTTDLLLLALRDTARENTEVLAAMAQRNPEDPLAKLGKGILELRAQRTEHGERLLREVLLVAPDLIEAQVQLGKVLYDSGRSAEFLAWNATIPPGVESHPELWALRGDFAQSRGELPEAARCYWESLHRDPCYQRAAYQLGQVLLALNQPDQAATFVKRAGQLQGMLLLMKEYQSAPSLETLRAAAALCEEMGQLWEAWGWSRAALRSDPGTSWATANVRRLEPRLAPSLPRTLPERNPIFATDLSGLPVPTFDDATGELAESAAPDAAHLVRFVDEAAETGIHFVYFNDHRPELPAARPFEFTGGGVAILDYDQDGWPDVYLTQGCRFPQQDGHPQRVDCLFRNLGNGQFEDVTAAAGLSEDRYSQGVACGDYNNDGFADLYIGNLDANRMYRNNGDGTFSDVTSQTGTAGADWTTSCALADLNGDGLPDVYAVNYLAGDDVFERVCRTSSGEPRICNPHDFVAAADELYVNLGDGRFERWGESSGIRLPYGKGLGIVAGDLTGADRMDLFIANDTDANHFFVNATPVPGHPPRFSDCAMVTGLAFDWNGIGQACMGVAVGDANADLLLDLFVTNYFDESNTLYLQESGGLFRDASREAGLREPSLKTLGFGTQFLDGDADGRPDLLVVNGHVEDQSRLGIPYRMRAQYFRNLGAGRFVELAAESLGPYFERETLGRSLALVDWNRDLLQDAVISHLDEPAALLTNRTPDPGNTFAIELRGVSGSRDAVGTSVMVTCKDHTWMQQLTAGDGYQASNQRRLFFGVGSHARVDQVEIRWPGGPAQTFTELPVNCELLAVEGWEHPLRLPP